MATSLFRSWTAARNLHKGSFFKSIAAAVGALRKSPIGTEAKNTVKMGGSFSIYDNTHFKTTERSLLEEGISHFKEAHPAKIHAFDVPLQAHMSDNDQQHYIHTVYVKPAKHSEEETGFEELVNPPTGEVHKHMTETGKTPMVLMHGFGSGIGVYFAALPGLANTWDGPVLAIDSLGCGLSSRPVHDERLGFGKEGDVKGTEDFFVEGLESWRKSMGLDTMTLVAHSLGGYISVCYAEKYPDRVDRLLLVGCAGLPHRPENFEEKIQSRGFLMRKALGLWEDGFSPYKLARYGPGKTLMGGYVNRRFKEDPWVPKDLLTDYFYKNWTHGEISTGGYAHATLLGPAAYARQPLWDRIPSLDLTKKISFIYGESDWMNPENAVKLQQKIKSSPDSKVETEVLLIPDAGHNCMIDNPLSFVKAVITATQNTPPENRWFDRRVAPEFSRDK